MYQTQNGGSNWIQLGSNLPTVAVYDMVMFENQIKIATFGRGVFGTNITLSTPSFSPTTIKSASDGNFSLLVASDLIYVVWVGIIVVIILFLCIIYYFLIRRIYIRPKSNSQSNDNAPAVPDIGIRMSLSEDNSKSEALSRMQEF